MRRTALPLLLLGSAVAQQGAPESSPFREEHVAPLSWRHLGPANPVGRITDFAVAPDDPRTWYAATASGGLFVTANAGTTWQARFQHQPVASIGAVALAPSNPRVVWVGTGEENPRNSVGWGNGVYRSTDGGETWEHRGLEETFQIGHVAIHPSDPDTVYVAALGRLWGENPDRGVFRTTDGGATWEKVLYLDPRTGCIDVRIDPGQPDTVYAAMYERERDAFDGNDPAVRFGEKAGLYRSDDGGESWKRLRNGLPTCNWGRSGLALWSEDPNVVFAIVETERSGWATGERRLPVEGPDARRGTAVMGVMGGPDTGEPGAVLRAVTEDGGAEQAGLRPGDRVVGMDGTQVSNHEDLVEQIREREGGETVAVTFVRAGEEHTVELTFGTRSRGRRGRSDRPPFAQRLGGQRANVQDRQGDAGFETGGIFRSDDRGGTWRRLNSLTDRPFYYSVIGVNPRDDQRLYSCGVGFHASTDGGESFETINRGIHVDFHALWIDPADPDHLIACCDGGINETFDHGRTWQVHHGFSAAQYYEIAVDNAVPYRVWGGLQDNGTWGAPHRTRWREGITEVDWQYVWSGDGFTACPDPVEENIVFATSQRGNIGYVDLEKGLRRRIDKEEPPGRDARFNWNTPCFLSPHNRLTVYLAGNYAYRAHRHAHLAAHEDGPVQGELEAEVISPRLGRTERGTATAFAESPREPGLLFLGTDDGALWRSPDHGHTWEAIHDHVLGLPGPRYVSHIEPSHHTADRLYVTFEGHRSDDFGTYLYVSEDRGRTWNRLTDGLPARHPLHVVVEDPRNGDLLFAGSEYGCHVSLDRGGHWLPLGSGLPTVAVRDLAIQDRNADLVAGTHGRGAWVVDIAPLRHLTRTVAGREAELLPAEDVVLWATDQRVLLGHRDFRAENPPRGVTLYALLATAPGEAPVITIHDVTGKKIDEVTGEKVAGLQPLQWNARPGRRGQAPPGTYSARMKVGDETRTVTFTLHEDPERAAARDRDLSGQEQDR